MITAFYIENFKAIGESQRIPLKPITLIFGPNSVGKSSTLQSLALAHEAQRTGNFDVFSTQVGGASVDLGGFNQFLFRKDLSNVIKLSFEYNFTDTFNRLNKIAGPSNKIQLDISFGILAKNQNSNSTYKPEVLSYELSTEKNSFFRMSIKNTGKFGIDILDINKKFFSTFHEKWYYEHYPQMNKEEIIVFLHELASKVEVNYNKIIPNIDYGTIDFENLSESTQSSESSDRLACSLFLGGITDKINSAAIETLNKLIYLGPIRSLPPRLISSINDQDPNWFGGGGQAWKILDENPNVQKKVNEWLSSDQIETKYKFEEQNLITTEDFQTSMLDKFTEMRIDESQPTNVNLSFKTSLSQSSNINDIVGGFVSSISKTNDNSQKQLILKDLVTDTKVSPRDVGMGISQVLPILVSAFGSKEQLIAIEQPELHLHPALQTDLADVIIQSAVGDQKNRYIIETHSEHLILRILKRIKQTSKNKLPDNINITGLTPEDVAVLYLKPSSNGAKVIELPITDDGDFVDPWPKGFFRERYKELMLT